MDKQPKKHALGTLTRVCCGKTFGWKECLAGGLIGALAGYAVGFIMFDLPVLEGLLALLGFLLGARLYLNHQVSKRQQEFRIQFCDYLDSLATSLSCGKNSYEAFLSADRDMQDLYAPESAICMESRLLVNGLSTGERVGPLLKNMSEHAACEDVATFGEIFTVCSRAGGNLKQVVDHSKTMLGEKISVETEIQTVLTGPKNELNLMACMPLVILACLRMMNGSLIEESSWVINLVALGIFVVSYFVGRKMVDIRV